MSESGDAIQAFAKAAWWTRSVVAEIPRTAWDGPGLGEWNLRALVGHTSRALSTVHSYLALAAAEPDATALLSRAEEYFLRVATLPGADPATVRDRGVSAGAELGDDPAATFTHLAESVIAEVRVAGNPVVPTAAGNMHLHDYLGTRTFELVVHGLDICGATGRDSAPPAAALEATLLLTVRLAARGGRGSELLLAATGRGQLPTGFSVLQPRIVGDPDERGAS